MLIRPLPYADAERLVKLWEDVPGYSRMEPSPPNYRDWKARATCFEAMGALNENAVNVTGIAEPRRVDSAAVTADVLAMLGVQPSLGRTFTAADDREGAPGTAILGYALWQRDFGGDAAIVGRTVRIEDEPHVIVGVMPAGFAFPNRDTELWRAVRFSASTRS